MEKGYKWADRGDVNAFFGLVLDNMAGLLLITSLLGGIFQFPVEFALRHLIPGTAIGVFVGDLLYFFMALRLAKTSKSTTVTAMPLGLDTPSIFGTALFVLGPAFLHAKNGLGLSETEAATYAWQIGICALFVSGIFKVFCSFGSGALHRLFPRSGLLGSLAAIALVLISFLPLMDVMGSPVVGMVSLAIILTSLVGRVPLPFRIPGTVGALLVAGTIFYIMRFFDAVPAEHSFADASSGLLPREWMQAWTFSWLERMGDTVQYLPIVIPFALATVVGGIDCTESAAAAGDRYNTGQIIMVEAVATLAASFCGGVIQTTPYIGHPAYKAMGGRAAYTLATAVFVGLAGVLGVFGYFYDWVPKPAVYPILLFVGLEITAQSFLATPKRHYPAVAFACVPALALLSQHFVGQVWGDGASIAAGLNPSSLQGESLKANLQTAGLIANGFLLTSLFWSSFLAHAIDRRLGSAAAFLGVAAICTLFGVIHSPFSDARLFLPGLFGKPLFGDASIWLLEPEKLKLTMSFFTAYAVTAFILLAWSVYLKKTNQLALPKEWEIES